MAPSLRPITDDDLDSVGEFLHRNLNPGASAKRYADAFRYRWPANRPNHGYMLVEDGAIVGTLGAIYSTRTIRGEAHNLCNLSCWCVLPEYRKQSLSLLLSLIKQPGYSYVNLTPAIQVVEIGKAFGFQLLDGKYYGLLNRPLWRKPRSVRLYTKASIDTALLDPVQSSHFSVLRDLEHTDVTFLEKDDALSMIVHRPYSYRVAKRLPCLPAIQLLYLDLKSPFEELWPLLANHLLLTQRRLVTLIEQRLLPGRPPRSVMMRSSRQMLLSRTLQLDDIDYLYTELMVGLG